jgi:hypothetical protein
MAKMIARIREIRAALAAGIFKAVREMISQMIGIRAKMNLTHIHVTPSISIFHKDYCT